MGKREEIDRSLVELVGVVAGVLAPAGWVSRPVGRPASGTFVRLIPTGVMATAELAQSGFRLPADYPVQLSLRLGVGFERALDLSVLLTLRPIVDVVPNPATIERGGIPFELADSAGIPALAERIAAAIGEYAVAFAESFPDVETLIGRAAARAGLGAAAGGRHSAGPSAEAPSMVDLTLLAAAGHHDEVASLIPLLEAAAAARRTGRLERRSIRQLRRWLDAGSPPPPPAEQTLARLHSRVIPPGPSWSRSREKFGSSREAQAAVRARAHGKSVEELIEALEVEYSRRSIEARPPAIAGIAERLHAADKPFGRTRQRVRDARTVARAGVKVAGFLRNTRGSDRLFEPLENFTQENPEWLRPPDRAAYPVDTVGSSGAAVVLDDGVDDLLARVVDEAARHAGPLAFVDVWFSRAGASAGEPPVVVAHIGSHRVGLVPGHAAARLAMIFDAAASFDEDPVTSASLSRPGGRTWYLEFRLPRAPESSDAGPLFDEPGT